MFFVGWPEKKTNKDPGLGDRFSIHPTLFYPDYNRFYWLGSGRKRPLRPSTCTAALSFAGFIGIFLLAQFAGG